MLCGEERVENRMTGLPAQRRRTQSIQEHIRTEDGVWRAGWDGRPGGERGGAAEGPGGGAGERAGNGLHREERRGRREGGRGEGVGVW